jgi:NADPH-dependent ferric siderophore reductase
MPSIGRRLEEVAAGTRVFTVIGVNGPEEEQRFETKAELTAHWVHRPESEAADPAPILSAISELTLPQDQGFIWIGTEGSVSRAVRTHAIEQMGHSPEWLKASAYWSKDGETQE